METAKTLRDKGIKQSVEHADRKIENWSEQAYKFLLEYMKENKEFMIEDVRNAAIIPEAPSKRAWGSIAVRAAQQGLIKRVGYRQTKNKTAHCTPATVWSVTKKHLCHRLNDYCELRNEKGVCKISDCALD